MGSSLGESAIKALSFGASSVRMVYLGSTKVWPESLPVGTTYDFGYTGEVQSIELPPGTYKLECWGAQGGNVTGTYAATGSKGGYSEGIITLTETTTLYIFVGGQGTSYTSAASQTSTTVLNGGWNGGGAGKRTSLYNSGGIDGRSFPRGGGGATDISTVTSAVSYSGGRTTRDSASLLARCIVAGGGAGASARYTSTTTTSTSTNTYLEGMYQPDAYQSAIDAYTIGKQITLTAGNKYQISVSGENALRGEFRDKNWAQIYGSSFTPSSTDTYTYVLVSSVQYAKVNFTITETTSTTSTSTSSGNSSGSQQGGGTSGKGQYPGKATSAGTGGAFGLGASQESTNYRYCGGGGGGGWYGGGTGRSDSSISYVNYSGGGSGFVNTSANASSRPSGYTGLQLDSGSTIAGDSSHPSVSGSTEVGHSGNGYARITVIN